MMLLEHEGKMLLAQTGLTVPRGKVVFSASEAGAVARGLGGPVVVKAQVLFGGRGRAGGVVAVETAEEAEAAAARLFDVGLEGRAVPAVLVEERLALAEELYVAVTVDGSAGAALLLFSWHGGVDVEEVAVWAGEEGKLRVFPLSPLDLVREHHVRTFLRTVGLRGGLLAEVTRFAWTLYQLARSYDLTLVEVNPLGVTGEGRAVAVDAKIVADPAATFRRPPWRVEKREPEDELERLARKLGVTYVRLEGNVGIVASGAGLGMCTMDLVRQRGLDPANFLETGGGITRDLMRGALRLVVQHPSVRGVIVNLYGGVNPLVAAAEGIVDALGELPRSLPVVVKALGNEQEKAWEILSAAGVNVVQSVRTEVAVERLAELMGGSIHASVSHPPD